jgi:SSS family solute:Na+ symporter
MALLGIFAIYRGIFPLGFDRATGQTGDANTIIPLLFHKIFPAWSAGIAYATLAIAALIPAAVMSITAANLFTRSIYCEYIRPRASGKEEARVSQWASLLVKFGGVVVVILLDTGLATDLQQIGGVVVLQILPAVLFGLYTAWFHRAALIAGLLGGLGFGIYLLYSIPQVSSAGKILRPHIGGTSWPLSRWGLDSPASLYVGLIAFAVNVVIVVAVTLVLRLVRVPSGRDLTRPEDYLADADDPSVDRLEALLDGAPQTTGAHAQR